MKKERSGDFKLKPWRSGWKVRLGMRRFRFKSSVVHEAHVEPATHSQLSIFSQSSFMRIIMGKAGTYMYKNAVAIMLHYYKP